MKKTAWILTTVVLASLGFHAVAEEKPFLHPLFTDHMVLPRGIDAPVWGWAEPWAKVTVQIEHQLALDWADESGKWMVKLGPFKAGGPYEIKVQSEAASAVIRDVLVGDVWLCSGQSNMQWSVAQSANPREEIANANHPKLRLFSVPRRPASSPQELVDARWEVCSPQTIASFSAVGYYFGRSLHEHLDIPIGLIHSSWGGTIAEAWTSAESLNHLADFRDPVAQVQALAEDEKKGEDPNRLFARRMEAWWQENDRGVAENWEQPATGTADWNVMDLPGVWEQSGLDDFDGIVWFRHIFDLPADWAGKDLQLTLGPIDDADTTWVNGRQVGESDGYQEARVYTVPADALFEGRNVLAVRVLDTSGEGGFRGRPADLALRPVNAPSDQTLSLAGPWQYRKSVARGDMTPVPQRPGSSPNVATVLHNGMIAPLLPFGIRGAIWYQGESNASRPTQYRTLLPTLIEDWRQDFGVGRFPFLIVQLANFMKVEEQPMESDWAALREAQALTARHDPRTGLAVTIDIGEAMTSIPRTNRTWASVWPSPPGGSPMTKTSPIPVRSFVQWKSTERRRRSASTVSARVSWPRAANR
jgi:sialate O-acetylesterase